MTIEISKKLISLLRLWVCIILSVLAFLFGLLSVFSLVACLIASSLSIVIAAFVAFYYIPRFYRSYSVTVNENALIVSRGVFIRRRYIMPCPRLIYFERTQTVASRIFGLYFVRVHAARARLTLPGLTRENALKLTVLLSGEYEK